MSVKIICLSLIPAILSISNIQAQEIRDKFFLGVDTQPSVFVGYRRDKLGLELGYAHYGSYAYSFFMFRKTYKQDSLYLNGLWFYPITNNLDLKILAGAELFHTIKHKTSYWFSRDASDERITKLSLEFRLGAGLEYSISKNLNMGLTYKLQTNQRDFLDVHNTNVSFTYYF